MILLLQLFNIEGLVDEPEFRDTVIKAMEFIDDAQVSNFIASFNNFFQDKTKYS